jgi:phosphoribosylanthranilate isomerase
MHFFEDLPAKPLAYIGVSAVDASVVVNFARFLQQHDLTKQTCGRLIVAAGFLITHRGLDAHDPPSPRQITPQRLGELLKIHHSDLFSIVHYVPRRAKEVEQEISRMAAAWTGVSPDALQINADEDGNHVSATDLAKVHARFSFASRVVLPVNRGVIKAGPLSDQVARIANWIQRFEETVSAVLVDSSEGKGEGIDAEWASIIIQEIAARFPGLVVGIAGGFRPENVAEKLQAIIKPDWRTPFNIDAQSGLRSEHQMSLPLVREYVLQAIHTLRARIPALATQDARL